MSGILQTNINFYASAFAIFTGPSYSPVLLGFLFRYLGVVVHSPLTHNYEQVRTLTSPLSFYTIYHRRRYFTTITVTYIISLFLPKVKLVFPSFSTRLLQVRQNLYRFCLLTPSNPAAKKKG